MANTSTKFIKEENKTKQKHAKTEVKQCLFEASNSVDSGTTNSL
jgi:hypothetical protein